MGAEPGTMRLPDQIVPSPAKKLVNKGMFSTQFAITVRQGVCALVWYLPLLPLLNRSFFIAILFWFCFTIIYRSSCEWLNLSLSHRVLTIRNHI